MSNKLMDGYCVDDQHEVHDDIWDVLLSLGGMMGGGCKANRSARSFHTLTLTSTRTLSLPHSVEPAAAKPRCNSVRSYFCIVFERFMGGRCAGRTARTPLLS